MSSGIWIRVRVKDEVDEVLAAAAGSVVERPNTMSIGTGVLGDTIFTDINLVGDYFAGTDELIEYLRMITDVLENGQDLGPGAFEDNDDN